MAWEIGFVCLFFDELLNKMSYVLESRNSLADNIWNYKQNQGTADKNITD